MRLPLTRCMSAADIWQADHAAAALASLRSSSSTAAAFAPPASMLFRCIVAAGSGRGVFDGNVRVNRLAQKTDAQQLSRNLLLVPRATVNVKPNLQASKQAASMPSALARSKVRGRQLAAPAHDVLTL